MYDRRGNYKVPLRADIAKYHDTDDIHYYCHRGFRQVQLLRLRNVYHYCRPNVHGTCTTTIAEDPMDVKFRVVTPNIYGHEPLLPSMTRERLLPL